MRYNFNFSPVVYDTLDYGFGGSCQLHTHTHTHTHTYIYIYIYIQRDLNTQPAGVFEILVTKSKLRGVEAKQTKFILIRVFGSILLRSVNELDVSKNTADHSGHAVEDMGLRPIA